jgi:hypothetical protein
MGLLQEISGDEKKPVIDTPGEPQGVVANGGEVATVEPEKISCSHLRTKKVLLIGTDPTGSLNWGDVESAIQCVECACILRESCPQ